MEADQVTASALDALKQMGMPVDSRWERAILAWAEVWSSWRRRRVTGLRTPDDVGVKIVADSFAALRWVRPEPGESCCDLGSGNGWPGLALKIYEPGVELVLVEGRKSACDFLMAVVRALRLSEVQVWNRRAEEVGRDEDKRERFATVVSRALGKLPLVLEMAAPLVRRGGRVVVWLGERDAREIVARSKSDSLRGPLELLGLSEPDVYEYSLEDPRQRRAIAVFQKIGSCNRRVPRTAGGMRRKPLWV